MRRVAALAAALALAGCVAPVARRPAPEPDGTPFAVPAPQPPATLATLVAGAPDLSRFRALAVAGDLPALLAGHGPVTILAPTDAAFARLRPGTVEALLLPGNRPSLRHLLRYWIVPGGLVPAAGTVRLPTLDGEPVTVTVTAAASVADDAAGRHAVLTPRRGSDGVLALLDGVLAPRSIEPGTPAAN